MSKNLDSLLIWVYSTKDNKSLKFHPLTIL